MKYILLSGKGKEISKPFFCQEAKRQELGRQKLAKIAKLLMIFMI